jgi:hypothetical protein
MKIVPWIPANKPAFAAGFLICMALWVGVMWVNYRASLHSVAESRLAGLARLQESARFNPLAHWIHRERLQNYSAMRVTYSPEPPEDQVVSKQIVRRAAMSITVSKPSESLSQVQQLCEATGGYIVSAVRNDAGTANVSATVELRVPAGHLDDLMVQVRKLAVRVESEQIEAKDVTKEYIDLNARIRNLRAEETQYLAIMKQARNVHDTLEVSEKLSDVRGEIEKAQGELNYLTHDVQFSSLTLEVRPDSESRVLGIYWRPWYEIKSSFRNGVEGLISYANAMLALVFWLPAILMWGMTLVLGSVIGFRVLRWAFRRFSGNNSPAPAL